MIGEAILSAAPALVPVARIVRSSHERFDGAGYPDRLAGEEIPLAARVVAVCDAYDAMTSDRAYRRGMSAEAALEELRRGAGTQFDPAVVEAFCVELDSRLSAERRSRADALAQLLPLPAGQQLAPVGDPGDEVPDRAGVEAGGESRAHERRLIQ